MNALISNIGSAVARNAPAILTAVGVGGTIGTAILAAQGAVRAHEIIVLEEERRHVYDPRDPGIPLTDREKFRLTWRMYIPAALAASATIVSVISAQSINSRRTAAALSLYTISERGLTEIREKIRETQGETKYEKMMDEIAEDRIEVDRQQPDYDKDHAFWKRQVEIRGDGVGLCKDMYSDRYFVSSRNEIDAAINYVNNQVNTQSMASLNEFYDQVGLNRTPYGEDVGWGVGEQADVHYTYVPAEDGSPCLAVTFKRDPESGFHRVWG